MDIKSPKGKTMENNNIIGLVFLLMGIVSLFIYLLNGNGDGIFNMIEALSFMGVFLIIPAIMYLI